MTSSIVSHRRRPAPLGWHGPRPKPSTAFRCGDLVMQRLEAAILILLGTAVQHALESTNLFHA